MDMCIVALQKQAAARRDVISLAGALPARELMPRAELARALGDVVTSRDDALQYGWPEGSIQLRAWIAARLAARGARVDPERVIITSGAQQAITLAAAGLRGGTVDVGDATYPAALDAFARAGLRAVRASGDACYVIPGVSNPHGVETMRRDRLLAGTGPLLVDEAYVELRFDAHVPRPLLADAPDRVVHIGTISKTLAPGLRLGWMIPPASWHAAALDTKQAADLQASSLCQAALVRLLGLLDYDRWVSRARATYAGRAAVLATALRRHVDGIRFREAEGGMSLWIETDDRGDELALAQIALEHGVMFDPGSAFRPIASDHIALRLSFANAEPRMLVEGARRLGRALARWRA